VHDWAYSPQRLTEVDLATGRVRFGSQVPAGSAVISNGLDLYVIGPNKVGAVGDAIGPYVLRRVTTSTLSTDRAVPLLPECSKCYQFLSAFQPAGPHQGDLWVAVGTELSLVYASNGGVVARIVLAGRGEVAGLAVEPDGRYLDAAFGPSTGTGTEVLELSTSTGKVVKRLAMPFAVTVPQLVAVPGGLWLSWRSGNAGTANFFREGSLLGRFYRSAPSTLVGPPLPGDDTMMGDWVTRVGDLVILTNDVGATCAQPTGKVLASTTYGHGPTSRVLGPVWRQGQHVVRRRKQPAWHGYVLGPRRRAPQSLRAPVSAPRLPEGAHARKLPLLKAFRTSIGLGSGLCPRAAMFVVT
jgi:hypothetical protein